MWIYLRLCVAGTGGEIISSTQSNSTSSVLYNITCPEDSAGFDYCSYSDMVPEACLSHQMDAVIACYEGESTELNWNIMGLYLLLFLILFSTSQIEPRDDCYSSYVPSSVYYLPNGTRVTTEYAELCVNNSLFTVCALGLDDATVQLLCKDRGADYGYLEESEDVQSYFYPPIMQTGIYNLNCSSYYSSSLNPEYCSYYVTYDHCTSYGGPALITCVHGKRM